MAVIFTSVVQYQEVEIQRKCLNTFINNLWKFVSHGYNVTLQFKIQSCVNEFTFLSFETVPDRFDKINCMFNLLDLFDTWGQNEPKQMKLTILSGTSPDLINTFMTDIKQMDRDTHQYFMSIIHKEYHAKGICVSQFLYITKYINMLPSTMTKNDIDRITRFIMESRLHNINELLSI